MLVKSKLKYIQSLGQKKSRDEEAVFIAEGPKLVIELLKAENAEVKEVFALKKWIDENRTILTKTLCNEITESELERISQLTTPNQVIAIVKKFDPNEKINTKGKITLVLDTIQDPGNMGTIVRTADWFGIEQIVCSDNCADIYNPKVVQSSMGSIARVKIFYLDLPEWLEKQKDVPIYAAVLEGQDMGTIKKIKEGLIIIGNESKGIEDEILKLANLRITIPQKGKAESLNAAVATGIILSHIA